MARVLISTPLLEGCPQALAAMPRLRAIAVAGAGADAVDQEAAEARAIAVLTAGEPLVETTADLAFALIIAACRQTAAAEADLRAGDWSGWRFDGWRGRDVHGARLALVGYGAIG